MNKPIIVAYPGSSECMVVEEEHLQPEGTVRMTRKKPCKEAIADVDGTWKNPEDGRPY